MFSLQITEVALVEYTNNSLYLGVIDVSIKTSMAFAKAAVKKEDNQFKFTESSISINRKDVQVIDSSYIIHTIKCKVVKNKICLTDNDKEELWKSFQDYIKAI